MYNLTLNVWWKLQLKTQSGRCSCSLRCCWWVVELSQVAGEGLAARILDLTQNLFLKFTWNFVGAHLLWWQMLMQWKHLWNLCCSGLVKTEARRIQGWMLWWVSLLSLWFCVVTNNSLMLGNEVLCGWQIEMAFRLKMNEEAFHLWLDTLDGEYSASSRYLVGLQVELLR